MGLFIQIQTLRSLKLPCQILEMLLTEQYQTLAYKSQEKVEWVHPNGKVSILGLASNSSEIGAISAEIPNVSKRWALSEYSSSLVSLTLNTHRVLSL